MACACGKPGQSRTIAHGGKEEELFSVERCDACWERDIASFQHMHDVFQALRTAGLSRGEANRKMIELLDQRST